MTTLPGRGRSVTSELLSLAAPLAGMNVLGVALMIADTAMCARLPDAGHVLVALGFAVEVLFFLLVIVSALNVGAIALVSRALGAGDRDRLDRLVRQSLLLCGLLGAGLGALGVAFAPLILRAVGAAPDIAELGAGYLRIMMAALPISCVGTLIAGILRALGNARVPFVASVGANLLNIALNYGLILGKLGFPALGIRGAAIATVSAQLFNLVVLAITWRGAVGRDHGVTLRLSPPAGRAWLDRALLGEILRVGAPAAIDIALANGSMLLAVVLLGQIDESAVAAQTIIMSVQAVALVLGIGISDATAVLVGQALGAGDVDRACATFRSSVVACVVTMVVAGAAIAIATGPILRAFEIDPGSEVAAFAVPGLWLLAAGMIPLAPHRALIGLLHGAGSTAVSLRINAIAMGLVFAPAGVLLAFPLGLGAIGVWLSFPLSHATKVILEYSVYRSRSWAITGASVTGS